MDKDTIFKQEEQYLQKVNTAIDNEIDELKTELREIPKKYTNKLQGDSFLVESLMSQCATRIHSIENATNSPYFGKFVFIDNKGKEKEFCVGRTYLTDETNATLITDWRAPISSIFYSSGIGPAEYDAPIGKITGEVTSKKQVVINHRELEKVFDTNYVSNDEILQSYLNTHADNRMKDIIATIQKEQYEIIRLPLNQNVLVQGIAGSGKTSIALHRLAFLIYMIKEKNEKTFISHKQFLILGPNNCFLDYISEVLPSMDIDNVTQETYLSLMTSELNAKYKILDNNEVLGMISHDKKAQSIARLKNSSGFIQLAKSFTEQYIENFFNQDLTVNGVTIINGQSLKGRLSFPKSGLQERAKNFKKLFIKNFKDNYLDWDEKVTCDLREQAKLLPQGSEERKALFEKIRALTEKCKAGFKEEVENYFAPLLLNPVEIYKLFINSLDENNNPVFSELKSSTLDSLKKKKITRDDLVAIMRIKASISELENKTKTLHIVIDESQDYSVEEFKLLKEMFPKATFSIFGDLSQSIYQYRSIRSWEDISSSLFDIDNIIRINKSYRTTDEIIKEADKISSLLNNEISLENVRHGNSVNYTLVPGSNKIANLENKINDGIANGYTTIAIICKTEEGATRLHKKMSHIPNINLITSSNNEYHGGVCIIPAALSKGLEFDYVIIDNVDNSTYDINDRNDLALLYVAMTRALHQLDVTYEKELFTALDKQLTRERKIDTH